ncbi:hypothetical protein HK104_007575, partial [Borealophlyctis nickersoniae]
QAINNTENVLNQQFFNQHNLYYQHVDAQTSNQVINNAYNQSVLNLLQNNTRTENNLTLNANDVLPGRRIEIPQRRIRAPVNAGQLVQIEDPVNVGQWVNLSSSLPPLEPPAAGQKRRRITTGDEMFLLSLEPSRERKIATISRATKRLRRTKEQPESSFTVEDVTDVRIPQSRRLLPREAENRVVLRETRVAPPDPLLSVGGPSRLDYGSSAVGGPSTLVDVVDRK